MQKNIQLVVFDMAGTTVNEDNLVYKTLHETLINAGYNCMLNDVLAEGAGKEKKKAIEDVLLRLNIIESDELVMQLYADFIEQLQNAYSDAPIKPYDDAEEVFAALQAKGIKVVLNTGYDRTTALQILERLHWQNGKQIDGLITASDVVNGRPAPDMIKLAMSEQNIVDSLHVVKVGDSAIDVEEGKNAHCGLSIGITTGAHTQEQLMLAKPDYIIHQLKELLPLL